jgi:DDE superfamily endonuclease
MNTKTKSNRVMKAMTGLSQYEFNQLLPSFEKELYLHKLNQPNRLRKPGGGIKGHLPDARAKLFFILFYIKAYPTFDVIGCLSGKSSGRSCEAVHLYLLVLQKALGKNIQFPERKITSVEELLKKFPDAKDIFIDGTERPIQRPKKAKSNKRTYSGKKKTHTRKHIVISDENKRILLVSPAKPGRRHDKKLTDKELLGEHIPKDVSVWADSGFQGLEKKRPPGSLTYVAKKARKNHPLTPEEKQENHVISHYRIVAENAIGGMKRYRATTDKLRNKIGWFDDRVMRVSAGLWNYHLTYRPTEQPTG